MAWTIALILLGNWVVGFFSGAELGLWLHGFLLGAVLALLIGSLHLARQSLRGRAVRTCAQPAAKKCHAIQGQGAAAPGSALKPR